MPEIVVYSKQTCPYCIMAKRLLSAKGQEWTEIDIEREPGQREAMIERTQRLTADGDKHLRIALDYSARDAIVAAARQVGSDCDAEEFSRTLATTFDVDLLIRTGKEQRLSDFMLWEAAFAELYFPDLYWPEFTSETLDTALDWYQQRDRRFGV